MSNDFIPANYDYEPEINQAAADGDAAGYLRATTDHRVSDATGTDENGTQTGFALGYSEASTEHRNPANVNGLDALGNPTGYNEGYEDASVYHTAVSSGGTDAKGRTRGYALGGDAFSAWHNTASVSGGNDSFGRERGYARGYKAARDFHVAASSSGNDSTGTLRGYAQGKTAGLYEAAHGLVTQNGDQLLSLNVYQKINMGSLQHAKSMVVAYNGLRAKEAGYYDVGGGVSITVQDTGGGNTFGYLYMAIVKNGSYLGYSRSDAVAYADDNTGMNCHFKNIYMAVNDVFYIYVKPVFTASNVNNIYARAWASGVNRQGSFLMAAKRT